MTLLASLLSAGSGLRAATAGVNAASHNVANASTPGFHRRSVALVTARGVRLGGNTVGLGVVDRGSARAGSVLLARRRVAQSDVAASTRAAATSLSALERFMGNEGTGSLRGSFDSFMNSLRGATANPSDLALRRKVVSTAGSTASNVSGAVARLRSGIKGIDEELTGMNLQVNQRLAEVARLDGAIIGDPTGLQSGDLMDRRDQLVVELSEFVGVRSLVVDNGSTELSVGGHTLVADGKYRPVDITVVDGAVQFRVKMGSSYVDAAGDVGGVAGGLLAARESALSYVDELDTFTVAFADAFNAQHAAGFDVDGQPGTALFSYDAADPAGSLALRQAIQDDPDLLALAGGSPALPGDGDNLTAMMGLQDDLLVGASRDLGTALSELGARVGADVSEASAVADHQEAIAQDIGELEQSIVGVSLDEEAANLMQFQTAYQASAKVMQTTNQMLSTLMQLV